MFIELVCGGEVNTSDKIFVFGHMNMSEAHIELFWR